MIGYTNVEAVLSEAGLSQNDNISAAAVVQQIDGAEGIVNGTIGDIYAMPLPFRLENSVTFEGDATQAGTITITINSVVYEVVVTDGQSNQEIADTFREAIRSIDTLQVDTTFDRAGANRVVFVSASMVPTTAETQIDVTATSLGTVTGITATEDTIHLKRYPLVVELITRKYAAAFLLDQSYGKSATGSDNDGPAKLERADFLLDKIADKKIKVVDDIGGGEIPRSDATLPQFNPTEANTAKDRSDEDSTPRNFEYRKLF